MTSIFATIFLVVGVGLTATAVSEPGNQTLFAIAGGVSLAAFVELIYWDKT